MLGSLLVVSCQVHHGVLGSWVPDVVFDWRVPVGLGNSGHVHPL